MFGSNDKKDPSLFTTLPPSPPPSDVPSIERSLTCQSRIQSPTECAVDWVLKVLGVLSAILFGIWAPVSYQVQVSGNSSNDQTTDQILGKIDAMTRELAELKGKMETLAVMRAWEFCLGRTNGEQSIDACEQLKASLDMNTLISQIMLNKGGLDNQNPEEQDSAPSPASKIPSTTGHNTLSMRTISQITTSIPTARPSTGKETGISKPEQWTPNDELDELAHPVISHSALASPSLTAPLLPGFKPSGFGPSSPVYMRPNYDVPGLRDLAMAVIAGVLLCVFVIVPALRWSARARKERAWANGVGVKG